MGYVSQGRGEGQRRYRRKTYTRKVVTRLLANRVREVTTSTAYERGRSPIDRFFFDGFDPTFPV